MVDHQGHDLAGPACADAGDARLLADRALPQRVHGRALTDPVPGHPPGAPGRDSPRLRPQRRLGQRAVSRDTLGRFQDRRRPLPVTIGQSAEHLAAAPQIRLNISHQAQLHRARTHAAARNRHHHPVGRQTRRPHAPVSADQPADPHVASKKLFLPVIGWPGRFLLVQPSVVSEAVMLLIYHAEQLRLGAEAVCIGPHHFASDCDERPGRIGPVPIRKADSLPLAVHPPGLGQGYRLQLRCRQPEDPKRRTWHQFFRIKPGALAQTRHPLAAIWFGNLPHSSSVTPHRPRRKSTGGHQALRAR